MIRAFGDVDLISGGDGNDTLWGNDDGDTISGDAGNDQLYGRNGHDTLQGGDGNDLMIGNLGDDDMIGGDGDDLYYVGQAGDVVTENLGEGFDTVRAQVDYTLTDNVEELFIGGAARSGTGNALDNVLHGSDSSNTLSGLAGADVLRGSGGRDLLVGGAGADLLDGGVGKDTLTGGAERDVFQFRDGDMGASRPLADLITDFSQADHEKIQLNLVDADTATRGQPGVRVHRHRRVQRHCRRAALRARARQHPGLGRHQRRRRGRLVHRPHRHPHARVGRLRALGGRTDRRPYRSFASVLAPSTRSGGNGDRANLSVGRPAAPRSARGAVIGRQEFLAGRR